MQIFCPIDTLSSTVDTLEISSSNRFITFESVAGAFESVAGAVLDILEERSSISPSSDTGVT